VKERGLAIYAALNNQSGERSKDYLCGYGPYPRPAQVSGLNVERSRELHNVLTQTEGDPVNLQFPISISRLPPCVRKHLRCDPTSWDGKMEILCIDVETLYANS
jgi:hypothetical protein